ncbi:pro-FMRFamide-related neuropeptide FF [Marmota marmota marmota]|uniref:Neuropeptide FF-amide peptide n=1 Tax=Marmota marmota marmota TaxID=9994 RepID=A0A8C6ENF0_MARMA|nr:pro-FMRFamide-related neuropeptide FF [Marmota marmota marmota]XP_027805638.1 pro-FMRFamide-related neuropeptide FF [Marmota flaviventris]
MDSRRVIVLLVLLLLTDWGHAEVPRGQDGGDQVFVKEDNGPSSLQHAQTPGSLLRSLLQAMERPGRSPAFLFQPQRFGRNTWGPWSNEQLNPRAGEFWSLAAPQRFGKK